MLGIHDLSAIHRRHHAVHARHVVLHADLDHLGHVGRKASEAGDPAKTPGRQSIFPFGFVCRQLQHAAHPRRVPRRSEDTGCPYLSPACAAGTPADLSPPLRPAHRKNSHSRNLPAERRPTASIPAALAFPQSRSRSRHFPLHTRTPLRPADRDQHRLAPADPSARLIDGAMIRCVNATGQPAPSSTALN